MLQFFFEPEKNNHPQGPHGTRPFYAPEKLRLSFLRQDDQVCHESESLELRQERNAIKDGPQSAPYRAMGTSWKSPATQKKIQEGELCKDEQETGTSTYSHFTYHSHDC